MKQRMLTRVGRRLMQVDPLRIAIADDEDSYFTPMMLALAATAGYTRIERHSQIDAALMQQWLQNTPDIIILDVKGVCDPSIAKDGLGVAVLLRRSTSAYVAVTSAHRFHLKNVQSAFDYVIEDRLMTGVDFIEELERLVDDFFERKARFYSKLCFRIGRSVIRHATLPQSMP